MRRIPCTGLLAAIALLAAQTSAIAADPATPQPSIGGRIIIDGSSTVWPVAADAVERYLAGGAETRIDLEVSGTGGGFRRFCGGESDIQNASRPITERERADCAEHGVAWREFGIALDGVTIVVSPENDFVSCLTTDQLRRLWAPDSTIATWQDLDAEWPADPIALYGPGPDSGTFDFFTQAIVGEARASRTDYTPSENDFYLVEEVESNPNALGYFGYAYATDAGDQLREVAVDSGDGCVTPDPATIADGRYRPLSRPLFIYVSDASLARPEVAAYLRDFLQHTGDIVDAVGYIPLSAEEYAANLAALDAPAATPTVS